MVDVGNLGLHCESESTVVNTLVMSGRHVHKQETYTTWPARYKAWSIEIHESSRSLCWVSSSDVRKVLPLTKADAELLRDLGPIGFEQVDKSKRYFFNERALTAFLKKNRTQDALLFLAWLEKTVYYPSRRKREDLPASPTMLAKLEVDAQGNKVEGPSPESLHVPTRKPVETFRSQTVTPRPLLKEEVPPQSLFSLVTRPLMVIWRGERSLLETIFGGGLIAGIFFYAIYLWLDRLTRIDDYKGDFVMRSWLIAVIVLLSSIAPIWWSCGVMRCALRYQKEHRGLWKSLVAFVLAACVLIRATTTILSEGGEWLMGWLDMVIGEHHVVELLHDPILGRMVLRGEIGFGSYKALESMLRSNNKLTLIQVESPGGYVVEGLAMAKLIQRMKLDTVSLERCASACTLLLAAGEERYVGPGAKVGFHRSGFLGQAPSTDWTSTDYEIADYYRSRGSSEAFINQALGTPSNKIWVADRALMMSSGYATNPWESRKAAY